MSPHLRILAIHTSTHDMNLSSSAALTRAVLDRMVFLSPRAEVRWIDASKLHIVENLSCYANGKRDCANPESGPYRCWAHMESLKDPAKYGGKDQMPVIYDGLEWADAVIFSTSTRWGSHSALCQKIIERMDTLENRATTYGEPYPLWGKKLGIVATGLHWHTSDVANRLNETLRWFGFATAPEDTSVLAWQRSSDPFFEHPGNDRPYLEKWTLTLKGLSAVDRCAQSILSANKVWV